MMRIRSIATARSSVSFRKWQTPAAHRAGWKDTVKVEGNVSEVLVKFNHDAPKEHAYMAHCHLLEHEDTGMMLGFTV